MAKSEERRTADRERLQRANTVAELAAVVEDLESQHRGLEHQLETVRRGLLEKRHEMNQSLRALYDNLGLPPNRSDQFDRDPAYYTVNR